VIPAGTDAHLEGPMQQSIGQRPTTATAVLGVLLIAVGAVALVLREVVGFDFFAAVGDRGWPYFVIVPGLVLLAAAFVPAPPRGIGFAIAGAIVTTVGGLLLYQSESGNWESWAYAWALIPMSAGLALVAYGLLTGNAAFTRNGTWLGGIAAVLLLTGAWFFGDVFAGRQPIDAGSWWPVGVIAIGALIVLRALAFPGSPTSEPPTETPGSKPI
jgi:hypothetical protein